MANKVLIEVHGSLVILKMLQMVRCGQVRSGVAGAVNSQTAVRPTSYLYMYNRGVNKVASDHRLYGTPSTELLYSAKSTPCIIRDNLIGLTLSVKLPETL